MVSATSARSRRRAAPTDEDIRRERAMIGIALHGAGARRLGAGSGTGAASRYPSSSSSSAPALGNSITSSASQRPPTSSKTT